MTDLELCYLPASEALRLFRARKLSPVELMKAVVARPEASQPAINAFTFRDNFLRNAHAGLLPTPKSGRDRWLQRLDYVVSWLVWIPCAVFAFPIELAAAGFGRGGDLVVNGKTDEDAG